MFAAISMGALIGLLVYVRKMMVRLSSIIAKLEVMGCFPRFPRKWA